MNDELDLTCTRCRLVWREHYDRDDPPTGSHALTCPRCGLVVTPGETPPCRQRKPPELPL